MASRGIERSPTHRRERLRPRTGHTSFPISTGYISNVAPTGLRSWRMKFCLQNKEKLLTFGPYPEVTLTEARRRRDDARRQLRDHVDPSGARLQAFFE